MKSIGILTNNSCPNSRAFNCPLLATKHIFCQRGYKLDFHWNFSDQIFKSDIVFVNSNVFRPLWKEQKEKIFSFLEEASANGLQIFWFDTTDSTWCTQFEVLPYVDFFLKSQMPVDREQYLKKTKTGRIFTDFFDTLYSCGEQDVNYPLPEKKHLHKLEISWNTCFENYNESRYKLSARIKQRLRPFTAKFIHQRIEQDFTDPDRGRELELSCRVGMTHSRPSVIAHRQAIVKLISCMGFDCSKIPLNEYFLELQNAEIGVGPFGVGEITLRDFEIIICGAALLKPNISHLETWPTLFKEDWTYIAHKWDLSDLEEKIHYMMFNPDITKELAQNAQNVYKHALCELGLNEFTSRIIELFN